MMHLRQHHLQAHSLVRAVRLLCAVVCVAGMAACSHKELTAAGASHVVHVLFNWDRAPEADPAGMSLYFFPDDGRGGTWRFDIAGRDGGDIELPVGRYLMVACNNDLPGVRFDGTASPDLFAAMARRRAAAQALTSTGMLYGATVQYVHVTPCGITYLAEGDVVKQCGQSLLRCHPDSLATHFAVEVRDIEGASNIRRADVMLKGVGNALLPATDKVVGTPDSLLFKLAADGDATLRGDADAFAATRGNVHYSLTLMVTTSAGKVLAKTYDVTAQVLNSPSPWNVLITIDSLTVPGSTDPDTPGEGGGGFDVGVEGWTTIEIDLSTDVSL